MLQKCDSFNTLNIWYECITAEWRKTLAQASLLTSHFDKIAQWLFVQKLSKGLFLCIIGYDAFASS